MASEFPAVIEYQARVAEIQTNHGDTLAVLGRWKDARLELEAARDWYLKVISGIPAKSAYGYQNALATTRNNLGNLFLHMGESNEALKEYLSARELQMKLVHVFPSEIGHRQALARTQNGLGALLKQMGKGNEATTEYAAACDIQKRIADEFPAIPEYQLELAMMRNNLGNLLGNLGKTDDARRELDTARALCKKLVAEFPTVPDYQVELASSHNNMGILMFGHRKFLEADVHLCLAIAIQEKLCQIHPGERKYQISLGGSYCNFASLLRDKAIYPLSLEWFDKAVKTLSPIHERHPQDVTAKEFLRNSYEGRAEINDILRKLEDGAKDWDKALELSSVTHKPKMIVFRAASRFRSGQIDQGITDIEELTKAGSLDSINCYNFCCYLALESGKNSTKKEEYAKCAIELLKRSMALGFKDYAHLRKDKDLDPLRDREDFKKLLAEIEKKSLPKAK